MLLREGLFEIWTCAQNASGRNIGLMCSTSDYAWCWTQKLIQDSFWYQKKVKIFRLKVHTSIAHTFTFTLMHLVHHSCIVLMSQGWKSSFFSKCIDKRNFFFLVLILGTWGIGCIVHLNANRKYRSKRNVGSHVHYSLFICWDDVFDGRWQLERMFQNCGFWLLAVI